ncbi:MAG TPA: trehalose-6-phosphate synthase [Anaeromyxobacter sp.]|nr:trehalose-6-phosphate synthase [Anaeromyxobacter sp.]
MVRVLLPLLAVLGALAWGATALVNDTTRSWFMRDVSARARLAASGARESLVAHVKTNERRRFSALLDELSRDDRAMAASLCSPQMRTLARTDTLPASYACEQIAERRPGEFGPDRVEPLEVFQDLGDGLVHLSVTPLRDEERVVANLVVVHDLSFVARREASMRRFTMIVFVVVSVLASLAALFMRRLSWTSWTEEMRRLISLGRPSGWTRSRVAPRFTPLLSDIRDALAEAASERGAGGKWTPERLQHVLRETLHGDSVIVVANREPYVHQRAKDGSLAVLRPASGLVTALEPVLRACSGVWIAHGSGSADRAVVNREDRVLVPPGEESYSLRRVWLSQEEERGYYYGFSNEGLWPLCHQVYTRPAFRAADWRQYDAVNAKFADGVRDEAEGADPIVLIQDYHFALAPAHVRRRLPRATVITFWHIPWPHAERLGVCPWARELLDGLLGSSIVGFHTQQHCNNFLEGVDRFLEARIDRERMSVVYRGHECLVRPYPISIEWPNGAAQAAPPVAECRRAVFAELGLAPDARLGIGVDRLDYTKGIEERLLAVERALERFPQLQGKFTFVQLGAPSRTLIPEYRRLDEQVEALARRIDERFARGTWRPVVLLRAHHDAAAVFRYMRAADLCYVSSLHDGMNLVAKEYVAARDDERGVLVLSRFTGAARELAEALLVNPYDLEEASAALFTALEMPPAEQAERMRALRAQVSEFNVYRWAGRMLSEAGKLRARDRLSSRLALGIHAVDEVGA